MVVEYELKGFFLVDDNMQKLDIDIPAGSIVKADGVTPDFLNDQNIDVRDFNEMGLELRFKGTDVNQSGTLKFWFSGSFDKERWEDLGNALVEEATIERDEEKTRIIRFRTDFLKGVKILQIENTSTEEVTDVNVRWYLNTIR